MKILQNFTIHVYSQIGILILNKLEKVWIKKNIFLITIIIFKIKLILTDFYILLKTKIQKQIKNMIVLD